MSDIFLEGLYVFGCIGLTYLLYRVFGPGASGYLILFMMFLRG